MALIREYEILLYYMWAYICNFMRLSFVKKMGVVCGPKMA